MARTTPATPVDRMAFAMEFLEERRQASKQRREEYLAKGYIECIVPGCDGLVAPPYQKDFKGQKVGFCPRTDAHKRLAPAMFASR